MQSGDSGIAAAAQTIASMSPDELDGSATPVQLEQSQMGESSSNLTTPPVAWSNSYVAREYIWGPGDNGLDELLVQYDENRNPWWIVQDAGLDVVAQIDLGATGSIARVVGEWTYDAYGRVVTDEQHAALSEPHAGHKGLFFDRLDAGVADPYTYTETPRLVAGSKLSGHVRNRTLHSDLGRWNQRDPNMTGLVVQEAVAYHGLGFFSSVQGLDFSGHFGDGTNVYQYLRTNTWLRMDPSGLFSLAGGLAVGANMALNTLDTFDQAYQGVSTTLNLGAMLESYSFWQEYDVDWAVDWSASDHGSSGAIAMASEAVLEENHSHAMAGVRGPGTLGRVISRAAKLRGVARPSKARIDAAIQKAQTIVGSHPRHKNPKKMAEKIGGAYWRSADGKVGFRLEPPHHRPKNPDELDWHINWFNHHDGTEGVIKL